jgi:hypothetical protein
LPSEVLLKILFLVIAIFSLNILPRKVIRNNFFFPSL